MIEHAGAPVGWLATARDGDGIELVRIDVLPDAQRHGIGSTVLDGLLAAADADDVAVRTRVLKTNLVAWAWYQRRGFAAVGDDGVLIRLVRPPGGASGTS